MDEPVRFTEVWVRYFTVELMDRFLAGGTLAAEDRQPRDSPVAHD